MSKEINIEEMSNEDLKNKSNEVFESLSNILNDEEIESLNILLDLERELTLREEL